VTRDGGLGRGASSIINLICCLNLSFSVLKAHRVTGITSRERPFSRNSHQVPMNEFLTRRRKNKQTNAKVSLQLFNAFITWPLNNVCNSC
jgi:predicted adenine nucleotide alpha hydrolase (AANH) superfamily ATPase